MNRCLSVLVLWTLISLLQAVPTPTKPYPHSFPLADNGRYHLFWKYDEETITFEVHVETTGYVALGISKTGGMKDADIFIAWVKDGKAYIQDHYAVKTDTPKMDDKQDWVLLDGSETDTHTIITVSRKLKTCDMEDVDITHDTVKLIWAYHKDKEPSLEDADPPYHGINYRGTRSIQLLTLRKANPQLPKNAKHIDFLVDKVKVPVDKTTYWCTGFSMPTLATKHHVVKIEPIIEEKNQAHVHHIVMYGCYHEISSDEYSTWDDLHGVGDVCYSGVMPTDECFHLVFAWAVGEEAFYYPDHVGYPMGGPDEKTLFLRMETHYDNPESRNDIVDSSGLRIHVTEDLRDNDAGLIEVGIMVNPNHFIPPKAPNFKSIAYCPRKCMEFGMDSTPEVKMFAGFLHTHLVGSAIRLRHFREGKELPPIYTDENYDFDFQEVRLLQKEVPVKPTDELVMECQYNTMGQDSVTRGGLGTKEEMCLAFMQYYPKIDFSQCLSLPSEHQTLSFIGEKVEFTDDESFTLSAPVKYAGKTISTVMNEADWDDSRVHQRFQDAAITGTHILVCRKPNNFSYEERILPQYVKPMELKDTPCGAYELWSTASLPNGQLQASLMITAALLKLFME